MAKNNVTGAGIGRAIFSTRLQLTIQAAKMCVEFGLIPGFLIPMCIWFSQTSGHIQAAKMCVEFGLIPGFLIPMCIWL